MELNQTIFSKIRELTKDSKFVEYDVCIDIPPKIASDGIWADHTTGSLPLHSSLTIFELQILVIFVITQCSHFLLKRLGFPFFVSQIAAGIILGPSLKMGALTKYKMMLFPFGSEDTLAAISGLGYSFYLFLSSVQMDFSMITRTGKKAWTIAMSTLVIPTLAGYFFIYNYKSFWDRQLQLHDSKDIHFDSDRLPVIVMTHSGYHFPVIASLLSELDILNSELGRLALSSALVGDVSGALVTAFFTAIVTSNIKGNNLYKNVGFLLGFVVLIPLIGRPAMKWVVRNTQEGRPVKKIYTYAIILLMFISGYVAQFFQQPFFAGPLVWGFTVPEGPPLGSEFIKQLELFSTWFLTPIFVTSCVMKVDITIFSEKVLWCTLFFIVLVHLLKLLICLGICRHCHMPMTDGFCLTLILSCKGAVDICDYTFLYDAMNMSSETMSVMVLACLVLGTMARVGVKYLYDPSRKYAGYQKRNILSLKPNSELRIVACIHKPCHIAPIKNALDLCCPTASNPLVVDVLHLMELVGRSSPIFISHRLQEKVASGHHDFSGDVIVTFNLFEHDNPGAATVNTYTAVSPMRLMHEDVCYLSLDKLASIIILPFHVRWNDDGTVESDDDAIRSLNSKVLEKAPCSVGILANRGSSSNHSETKQVAMIFLGGADDREALCLAKRSTKESNYNLVVYHLVAGDGESINWDLMLDDEVLKDVKGAYGNLENVSYERITIQDPSQTTSFLSDLSNYQYDFIVVGRRYGIKSSQTAALENWIEYPELGAIGDLLASQDINIRASILVVQQQQITGL